MSKGDPKNKNSSTSSSTKGVTENELTALRTAFDLLDRNRDGRVTVSELQFMLENLGIQLHEEYISQLVREASNTGAGLIDEAEFLQWIGRIEELREQQLGRTQPAEEDEEDDGNDSRSKDLVAAFRVFDRDCNGFITRDELRSAMDMIGEQMSDQQLGELLTIADVDKDGRINYEEFARLLL